MDETARLQAIINAAKARGRLIRKIILYGLAKAAKNAEMSE